VVGVLLHETRYERARDRKQAYQALEIEIERSLLRLDAKNYNEILDRLTRVRTEIAIGHEKTVLSKYGEPD